MKPRAIIIDLDNTLCKNRKQATSDMKHWKDYWPLYKHIPEDEPQEWCVQILDGIYSEGYINVVFLTARPEHTRKLTVEWLRQRLELLKYDYELIMMPDDYPENKTIVDYKRDEVRKIKEKYDILFAIDDNLDLCKMYEGLGIKALWCNVK